MPGRGYKIDPPRSWSTTLAEVALIVLIIGLAAIAFDVAKSWTTVTLAQTSVTVTPFTFETETYNFESDEKGKPFHKEVVARRSDGSTVKIATVGRIEWGTTTRKITHTTGVWASVYDLIEAKTTWQMHPAELAALKERLRNPPVDCVFQTAGNPSFVRNDIVLGHELAVIQTSTATERGTFWRARNLGCEELQFRFESR
ncbi:MAG TPA: hypothetical protein VFI82_00075 [Terriglobales bacterium]|nr:hypothetical protein [Terriglobales bacterium]